MDKFIKAWRKSSHADLMCNSENSQSISSEKSKIVSVGLPSTLNVGAETDPAQRSSSSNDDDEPVKIVTKKSTEERRFSPDWQKQFQWLVHKELQGKAYCSVCTKAFIELNVKRPAGIANERVYDAFVKDGFSSWNKAIERFKVHEKSNLHITATTTLSLNKKTNVSHMLSTQLMKDKKDARCCLMKIFQSIRFLAVQGIPLRGRKEENSNFVQLLHLRSLDQPLLNAWMGRSKYKWISHEIVTEILTIMAMSVRRKLLTEIRNQPFYAIMADETTDVSRKEQMSINFRYVDECLAVHESFLGFYETPSTDSHTLFKVLLDVLTRFDIDVRKCRGQCYDGAFNMSGEIQRRRLLFELSGAHAEFADSGSHRGFSFTEIE